MKMNTTKSTLIKGLIFGLIIGSILTAVLFLFFTTTKWEIIKPHPPLKVEAFMEITVKDKYSGVIIQNATIAIFDEDVNFIERGKTNMFGIYRTEKLYRSDEKYFIFIRKNDVRLYYEVTVPSYYGESPKFHYLTLFLYNLGEYKSIILNLFDGNVLNEREIITLPSNLKQVLIELRVINIKDNTGYISFYDTLKRTLREGVLICKITVLNGTLSAISIPKMYEIYTTNETIIYYLPIDDNKLTKHVVEGYYIQEGTFLEFIPFKINGIKGDNSYLITFEVWVNFSPELFNLYSGHHLYDEILLTKNTFIIQIRG